MEEQLSGACTVEIAAFNEFTSLLADAATAQQFDHVVFDTAPTGHTLRLLSLPAAWTGFINTNQSGTSCLGPLSGLDAQRAQYASALAALGDPERTALVLVTRPDESALREAARAGAELRALEITNQYLAINGVLDAGDVGDDPIATAYVARQDRALAEIPRELADLPRVTLPLFTTELTGVGALRLVAGGKRDTPAPSAPTFMSGAVLPDFHDLVDQLAAPGRGVIMTMGKGGVGKTTVAARIAVALASRGHRVTLSTTDPAAHVDAAVREIAGAILPEHLVVGRIDPDAETRRYSAEVVAAAGDLEPDEYALLEEDLRSPCTEEIAVFRAFARTVAEATSGFVVLDTAPTGHTLLLLDAAESYHREVARTSGTHVPEEVRALLPRLRDPNYARMLLVTLPEATPILEAARLQEDLRRAQIEPYGWIVNASLAATGTRHPVLAARAQLEIEHIRGVSKALASRTWLIPWRP
jgi:arsenite-transporting ATPase